MNTLLPKRKMVQIKRSLDSVFLILAILKRKIIIDLTNGVYLDLVSLHLGGDSAMFNNMKKSIFCECLPGRRKIAVKVVDIFGNDTMKIAEVTIGGRK